MHGASTWFRYVDQPIHWGPSTFIRFLAACICSCCLFISGCNSSSENIANKKDGGANGGAKQKDAPNGGGSQSTTPPKATSLRALKLFEAGKLDEAWAECQKVMVGTPNDYRCLFVAGSIQQQKGKLDTALKLVDRIPLTDREYGPKAAKAAASWCASVYDFVGSEQRCRNLLANDPNDIDAITLLASQLDLQGRRFEASQLNQQLIRLGKFNIMTLVLAIDSVKPLEADDRFKRVQASEPNRVLLQSNSAFIALNDNSPETAEPIFSQLSKENDAPVAAFVGLGLALIEQEKFQQIPEWLSKIPSSKRANAESLPGFWQVLGKWAEAEGRYADAVYCLTKSAELDPFDYLTLGTLARVLSANKQPDQASEAETLFQRNQLTIRNVNYIRDGFRKPEWMLQIAESLEACGRTIEGLAWRELCESSNDKNAEKINALQNARKDIAKAVVTGLQSNKTGFSWGSNTLSRIDLDAIKSSGSAVATENTTPSRQSGEVEATLSWKNRAQELGVSFQYQNGDDPKVFGMKTYQSNGAGGSIIDFDRDGWADLYLLQGGGDPRNPASNLPCALYRNHAGLRFEDVASTAKTGNIAYGQGAAVGDFDQDGFADLFVLNFGENRLLRNMGDGTFEQVDVPEMKRNIQEAPEWSVSGAIADIDGDHLPEIIEINYSAGIDVITHECFGKTQQIQVCRPTEFPASRDYIYRNNGDGSFAIANKDWNLPLDDGRGLGIIVANFDEQHGNEIYIANDMSANNFLVSYPDVGRPGRFLLRDEAVRRGCAVDNQGKPQASMGVGCADVDRDGRLDLFITNFIDEYNALYLQSSNHSFVDASRRYQLLKPNKQELGFGTHLIDLDRDGWMDTMIVNGHVDDYTSIGQPLEMRPQILLQRKGAFVEQVADSLGAFFSERCLARSLSIIDFNHDGKNDFLVTRLDKPAALLQNESESNGNWIAIELTGVVSERDAIGAIVTVHCGEQSWRHQMIAGDGFECSNERYIHLGLGANNQVDRIEVVWPSGLRQEWTDALVTNRRVWLIEGRSEFVVRF